MSIHVSSIFNSYGFIDLLTVKLSYMCKKTAKKGFEVSRFLPCYRKNRSYPEKSLYKSAFNRNIYLRSL